MWSKTLASLALLPFLVAGCMNIRTVELTTETASTQENCGVPAMSGSGSSSAPYQVTNVSHLKCMVNAAAGTHYLLVNDINVATSGTDLTPITGFRGVFDGNNHAIIGFTYYNAILDKVGLFDEFDSAVTIKNLKIQNSKIEGHDNVGLLVGKINLAPGGSKALISNLTIESSTVAGNNQVSMVVGNANQTQISALVIHKSALVGVGNVGMAVGSSTSGLEISQAQIDGVQSASYYVGGLVGSMVSGVVDRVGVYVNLSIDSNSAQLSGTGLLQQEIGGIFGNVSNSALSRYFFVGTINATNLVSTYNSAGSIAGKATNTTFAEGYGAARSMTINTGRNVNGFIGENISGNTFSASFYFYQAGAVPVLNTTGVTELNSTSLAAVQTAFVDFNFNNIWKVANAPFRMPVLFFQDIAAPFLDSVYNVTPTAPIIMTEAEDASGNLFAAQAETAVAASKTITFNNYNTSSLKFKSFATAIGKSYSIDPTSSCLNLLNTNTNLNAATGITPAQCQVKVNFLPRTNVSAVLNDLLIVTYEYANPLEGSAIEAKVVHKLDGFGTTVSGLISDQNITFNSVASVTGSDVVSITITNSGTESVSLTQYEFEEGFTDAFSALTTNCGTSTLAPSGTCTITGTFTPGSSGNFSKTLKIHYQGAIHTETKNAVLTFNGIGI